MTKAKAKELYLKYVLPVIVVIIGMLMFMTYVVFPVMILYAISQMIAFGGP